MNTLFDIYEKLQSIDYLISTDTREMINGSMFFAWKGEGADGNDYIHDALRKGAAYVVMDNPDKFIDDARCLLVDNSMTMLQDIAHHHRMQFDIPVIGLTGSNGKTTTKELIRAVLGSEKKIIATLGNLNNHVGVPKTLLRIRPETEIAIIEMGANHVGEIAELCRIAHPTHGLITNIGRAHIGLFGGYENIVRGKTELYRYLKQVDGVIFVRDTDPVLLHHADTNIKITYESPNSEYPFISSHTQPYVSGLYDTIPIVTQLTGEYNIPNIAAACAVGDYMGISSTSIAAAISQYVPDNQRSEILETTAGNTIIKDYYNANRNSMEGALENFKAIKTTKEKIAILGDMFELGEYEYEDHLAIVQLVYDFDRVILVGKAFAQIPLSLDHITQYETTELAITELQKKPITDACILLKASQGMHFDTLFNSIDW